MREAVRIFVEKKRNGEVMLSICFITTYFALTLVLMNYVNCKTREYETRSEILLDYPEKQKLIESKKCDRTVDKKNSISQLTLQGSQLTSENPLEHMIEQGVAEIQYMWI